MAKTTEELIANAELKATKTETKRILTLVKEHVTGFESEDKGQIKLVKDFGKNLITSIKA